MTDAELLRDYVERGSEAAFAALVERHLHVVFFAAQRQVGGDAARAKDVAQRVFTELARKAPRLLDRPALVGWLYVATRFVALHELRAEQRRARREQEAHAMQTLQAEPGDAIHWEKMKPVIDDVLHDLRAPERDAVLMRFFEGKPFADIGTALGVSADAARFRVERTLGKMRTALARRGITSTSAALAVALATQAEAAAPAGLAATFAATALRVAATVNVATTLNIANSMTTAKTTTGIALALLGATIAGETWLGWRQTREIERLHRRGPAVARVDVTSRGNAVASAIPEIQIVRPTRMAAPTAPGNSPAATKPAVAPRSSATETAAPAAANFSQAVALAMNDPEFRRLLAQAERARLNLFYNPLFRKLNLAPVQLDRFKELLVDKQQSVGDANRSALSFGMSQDAAYASIHGAQSSIDADIWALLGESGFAQYQEFEASRGQRLVAEQLRQSLSYTAAPLTATQAAQLTQILYQNSPPRNPPSTDGLGAQVGAGLRERDLTAPITDQGLAQAATILSPTQLAALGKLQQQQRERQRIAEALKQLRNARGGREPHP